MGGQPGRPGRLGPEPDAGPRGRRGAAYLGLCAARGAVFGCDDGHVGGGGARVLLHRHGLFQHLGRLRHRGQRDLAPRALLLGEGAGVGRTAPSSPALGTDASPLRLSPWALLSPGRHVPASDSGGADSAPHPRGRGEPLRAERVGKTQPPARCAASGSPLGLCGWAAAAPGGSGASGTLMIPGGATSLPTSEALSAEGCRFGTVHQLPEATPRLLPPPGPADALAGQKYPVPRKPCAPRATKYPGSFRPDAGGCCRGRASLGPGAGACSPRPGARSGPREAGSRPAGPNRPWKGALVSPPCSLPRSPQLGPQLSAPIANIPTDKTALHRGASEGHGPAGQTFLRIN